MDTQPSNGSRPSTDGRPRIRTRHPGVYYRLRADGTRQHIYEYTDSEGKQRFKNFPGGERETAKERAKVIGRLAKGEKIAPSRVTFADFARSWLKEQHNLSPKSVETYRNAIEVHLIPRLGTRTRLSEVDVDMVARMIQSMQKDGKKAWTIRTTLTPLSRIMASASRRGLAPTNPVAQLERSERPQGDQARMNILDSDEIRLLLSKAGRWRTLIATAIFTGLRVSELLALEWGDIDWAEGVIHVRGTKSRAAQREVTLMPALQQILASHWESTEGLVFTNSRGGPLLRDVVRKDGLYPALIRAGIVKHVRFHDLRHTFASILISQGCDAAYVAEQMGHASIATTLKTYAKLFDGKKKRETARERMQAQFGEVLA